MGWKRKYKGRSERDRGKEIEKGGGNVSRKRSEEEIGRERVRMEKEENGLEWGKKVMKYIKDIKDQVYLNYASKHI